MKDVILSLCDITGKMVEPWLEAGYEAILVDPQHENGITVEGPITKVGYVIDAPETWKLVRDNLQRLALVAAFPPCTDLAVSGARWFSDKEKADPNFQHKAMQVVWHCHAIAELSGAPYFIENPVSRISTFWRKPDFIFQPYQFTGFEPSDNYTKKTCLWTGGGWSCRNQIKTKPLETPTTEYTLHPQGRNGPTSGLLLPKALPKQYSKLTHKNNKRSNNDSIEYLNSQSKTRHRRTPNTLQERGRSN